MVSALNHLRRDHGVMEDVCVACPDRKFSDDEDRRVHNDLYHYRRFNKMRRTQPCKQCQFPLNRAQACNHMQMEHGKPNQCPFCPFSPSNLDMTDMNSVLVTTSTKDTDLLSRMKQHVRMEHPMNDPEIFVCGCKKRFRKKEDYNEHRSRKIPDTERKIPICKHLLRDSERAVCGHCGLTFQKNYLAKHSASAHGVDVEETLKFACKYCPKRYEFVYSLKKHMTQKHFPEKKEYFCEVCPKVFSTRESLVRHNKIHGSKKYKCPRCPKVFNSEMNVRQHLRGIHYPPAFECKLCGRMFHHHHIIKPHLRQIHKVLDYDASIAKHSIDMTEDLRKIPHLTVEVADS